MSAEWDVPDDWWEDVDGRSECLNHEKVAVEIKRLLAVLAAGFTWQPIGTVPKDGSEVLLGFEDDNRDMDFYRWNDEYGWLDRFTDGPSLNNEPSHWMKITQPGG
jgi:hypothetical protein